MADVRVVRAHGDPATRGREIGRALGDLIERSLAFYDRYFERRGVASDDLRELLSPYVAATEARLPHLMAAIKAMAEGAYVPVWELFAVNAFEELEPLLRRSEDAALFRELKEGLGLGQESSTAEPRSQGPPAASPERCATFTVTGPGFTLLGHNEMWMEGDRGNTAVVIEIPDHGGRAIVSPTIVGCLPAVGMNEHGGAQGVQSLRASD